MFLYKEILYSDIITPYTHCLLNMVGNGIESSHGGTATGASTNPAILSFVFANKTLFFFSHFNFRVARLRFLHTYILHVPTHLRIHIVLKR